MDLDPRRTRLCRDDGGVRAVVDGFSLRVARMVMSFPKSEPGRYVALLDAEGHEMGTIERPDALDEGSLALLKAELATVYATPIILAIRSVAQRGSGCVWEVSTDAGGFSFAVRDRDALDGSDAPAITVTDERGKRYRIADFWALDAESRACMMDLLPDRALHVHHRRGAHRAGDNRGT